MKVSGPTDVTSDSTQGVFCIIPWGVSGVSVRLSLKNALREILP
ncbi:hypothetical protein ECP03022939_1188 [Escherichia coli P0302293.9]|nr:hypothetical protein ECP03022932_1715 [Escherichia coli P0302293.2]END27826.1 hypothetical protein ECP03023084_1001 [Escherichia coli P0302308.4]ENE37353.1 hypothetical protein ECP03022936_1296 [Escherichia coli P0302293.6]ENE53124.1 hypothetical protein ECP03022939_1188 [Escherichia coli P0302293.9]ENH23347.1 hypothetical protein ECP030230812_1125 [Escherichia coli P0302308.12]